MAEFPPAKRSGPGPVVLLPIILLALGLTWFVFAGPLWQILRASYWKAVPCRIVSSDVRQSRGSQGGAIYKVAITYDYKVAGTSYRSSRYRFLDFFSSGRRSKAEVVRRLPPGSESVCFVNPASPEEAVLMRGANWELWFGVLPFSVLLFAGTRLLQSLRPARPLRWDSGEVVSRNGKALLPAWGIAGAVIWMEILLWFIVSSESLKMTHPAGIAAMAIGLVGMIVVGRAVYVTARYLKFGESVFKARALPASPGGPLEGEIRPGRPLRLYGGEKCFALRLQCLRRFTSGTGRNRGQVEEVCWEEERPVEVVDGTTIPVAFALSPDARESTTFDSGDGIFWRLEARAPRRGIDRLMRFEVPVLRGELSPEQISRATELRREETQERAEYRPPASSPFRLEPSAGGGTRLVFPAFRNLAGAFTLFGFSAALFAVAVAFGMPFMILLGIFGLLMAAAGVEIGFKRTEVTIERGEIVVTNRRLGLASSKRIVAGEVLRIGTKVGGRTNSIPWFVIELALRDGKKITVGSGMHDRREADWLAAEMGRLAGVPAGV